MPETIDAGAFDLVEDAPAKINLALHVTGRRADGYHLLDTLVTFARHGDQLMFRKAEADSFSISGRFSDDLPPADAAGSNLVVRARDLLRAAALARGFDADPVHIHLRKNLPVASGIGGGSADASAALRGLLRLWTIEMSPATIDAIALRLGADVPMCLISRPLVASGIGEDISLLSGFPAMAMVLGNPLVGVSTPDVFARLAERDNPPLPPLAGEPRGHAAWLALLDGLRNDLEPPARSLCGEIGQIADLMTGSGAHLVRMSGSGATCFALYHTMEKARAAATCLHSARPDWYFQATQTVAGDL